MITIGAIKKAAKEYDLEVVQRLSLPNLAINKICNLESCTILVELSLPHNEIRKIEGLDSLVKLQTLNLACNQITKVNNLASLENLERLDLRGNRIDDCDNIQGLAMVPTLTRLYLQFKPGTTPSEKLPNPICSQAPYLGAVKRCAPALRFLDGETLELKALAEPDEVPAADAIAAAALHEQQQPTQSWYSATDDLKEPDAPEISEEDKAALVNIQGTVRECSALNAEAEKMMEAMKRELELRAP